jgi:AcrR family transcriptional regulator
LPSNTTRRRKTAPRTRATLSSERILAAAMQLALDSPDALSLSRLGTALDADPTAVYRHFHSRDDLLRAMADAVHEEVDAELEQIPEDVPWREALERHLWTIRRCFLRYPALAREYCHRVSGGTHEARGVRRFADVLLREGLTPEQAVSITRAAAVLVFGSIAMDAGFAMLPEAPQREEINRLVGVYRPISPEWALTVDADDPAADLDTQFALALELLLDGIGLRVDGSPGRDA